jgi:MscS family membrane protein
MDNWTDQVFLGNTIGNYLLFATIIFVGLLLQRFLSRILARLIYSLIRRYSTGVGVDQFLPLLVKPVGFFIFLFTLFAAFNQLEYPAEWNLTAPPEFGIRMIIEKLYGTAYVISIAWIFLRMTDFLSIILLHKAQNTPSKSDDQLVPFIRDAIKLVLIIMAFFFILGSVFSMNITSLITGLGIGGLAIALAAKETLENLLGSFTIFLDKPFVVGDLVQVGPIVGHVENVGFRSTRIRTLEKSYVTVPNKKMIDAELDNLTLRTFRRARFDIGLVYSTTVEQLQSIIADIQTLLDNHPHTNQEGRVRFMEFGESSLDIMVQYFVDTMDWDVFIQVKEEINFEIMKIVEHHGSSFAFPTQSVYLEKPK